jgi:hypothetical protein
MNKDPYDEPSKVSAVDGEVVLDGPDGVGVSVTPEAAKETSRRLADKAGLADAQNLAAQRSRNRTTKDGEPEVP